jgi:hypothetical protein
MSITKPNSGRMKGEAEAGPIKGSMMNRDARSPSNSKKLGPTAAGGNTSATNAGRMQSSTTQPGQAMMVRALRGTVGSGPLSGGSDHETRGGLIGGVGGNSDFSGRIARNPKSMPRTGQKPVNKKGMGLP